MFSLMAYILKSSECTVKKSFYTVHAPTSPFDFLIEVKVLGGLRCMLNAYSVMSVYSYAGLEKGVFRAP